MTTVTFDSFKLNNIQQPLTLEEIFRHYGNWSGIHDYMFDDLYTLGGSDWTGQATGSYATGTFAVNAIALASGWYDMIQDGINLPANYAIYYHKQDTRQAIIISQESGELSYLVGTDDNGYPFVATKEGGDPYSTVFSIPIATPEVADVVVGFRQVLFTDDNTEIWYVISMWMNDKLFLTYIDKRDHVITSSKFGLGAYGGESIDYSSLRIPDLTEFAEWGSLDPGESAYGGLNRVLEGRYLKYFVRHDGAIRAWRPKSVDSSKDFSYDVDLFQDSINVDVANIFSHIRMVGAYLWAEFLDTSLLEKYGHKFKEENNPMLFTERECAEEAERTVKRNEEASFTSDAEVYGTPLLEPEDRVETDAGDWLITSINQDYEMGNIKQSMGLRRYVWGD